MRSTLDLKHRNAFIFSGASGSNSELISSALAWTKSLGVKRVVNQRACTTMTFGRWQPPVANWVKVNVDGLMSRNNPKAFVGGIVRGPNGGWLIEAKAILEGLKLAWAKEFKCVEMESDNAMLIEIIRNGLATVSSVAEVRQIHD
ncbi:hypothetical protein PVK06_042290 [Gossypium arboreum]|uniref:RNase H type-1 domain-containing protein n=1 Tax=Gossypium arboreum TaxID=29729 RepID=A0ABR0MKW7_GOSAR|nr:hypothetical protein PVK06_042290 [Gossypium arboreum]